VVSIDRRQFAVPLYYDRQFTTKEAIEATSATELAGLAVRLAENPEVYKGAPTGRGPLLAYQEGREEGLLRKDDRQEATVVELQRLYDELIKLYPPTIKPRRSSGLTLLEAAPCASMEEEEEEKGTKKRPWWTSLFGTSIVNDGTGSFEEHNSAKPRIKGMYMFGGVGCGKTLLMDLFVATSPSQFKLQRIHFHDFMLDVHSRLRAHKSTTDPLSKVADDIMDSIRVMCLDELFVTDVADAMILHRLFARLWQRGLVLVATSNRAPDALYEGGLQRALFLPFIEQLKQSCVVHDMASPTDYRKLAQHREGLYYIGKTDAAEALQDRFLQLSNNHPIKRVLIEVALGRKLELPKVGGCIAYFDFDELCNRPLGAADYIALAHAKHSLAVNGIPVFTTATKSAAYRFVTLIDVLYEHKIRLLCSAEASPMELFKHVKAESNVKDAPLESRNSQETADLNLEGLEV
jgi:protein AFG1